jgi:hypothetical protein
MSGSKSLPPGDAPASTSPADEPLTLTVHSLPSHTDGSVNAVNARMGRIKMVLLMLVAASPVILSYFTYYVIRPEGRQNYGELIEPLRPIPAGLKGVNAQRQEVELTSLKNQWLFVSVGDSLCDERCQNHLYYQRQIREGLGKEKDRLDWVWLRTGSPELSEVLQLATAQAVVLHMQAQDIAAWLEPAPGYGLADHLFVVDPMGNWMMRFPAQADPKQMRRDINRLLRASSFWDRPGR